MRKKLISLLLAFALAVPSAGFSGLITASADISVAVTDEIFKDDILRQYVENNYDTDHSGTLSAEEIADATELIINDSELESLAGIEYLTGLEQITCDSCRLKEADLSKNTNLTDVSFIDNQLTKINVGNNPKLEGLRVGSNKLTSIDVSKCKALSYLEVYDNRLTSLNVRACSGLEFLYCYGNSLEKLDVSGLSKLRRLDTGDNMLTSLTLTGCTNLEHLFCESNELVSLDLGSCTRIFWMSVSDNKLSKIDISKCKRLNSFWCYENNLTELNTGSNESLEALFCQKNNLSGLSLVNNPNLDTLFCSYNNIVSLDVSPNSKLGSITCDCSVSLTGSKGSVNRTHRFPASGWKETDGVLRQICPYCNSWNRWISRVSGSDRFATSIAAAEKYKKDYYLDEFDNIVVACGTAYPDALSGSYLAFLRKAPMLLTANNPTVLSGTIDYIKNNLKEDGIVYILGGEGAVSKEMDAELEKSGIYVKRLEGENRYETNLAILKEIRVESADDLLVCTGRDFADSLSASAVSAPILLVPTSLTESQKAYLDDIDLPAQLTIIGGSGAVTEQVEDQLRKYADTQRVYGNNRFETALAVAGKFFPDEEGVCLVYSQNFPDGLSAGPLAARNRQPLILTLNSDRWSREAMNYIRSKYHQVALINVFGGEALISNDTVFKIAS